MKTPDLHDRFVRFLKERFSPRDLKHQIAGILGLSLDAAYRRVSEQVLFTPREIGIVCQRLGISLDRFLHKSDDNVIWMPFVLKLPHSARSMDELFDQIDFNLEARKKITGNSGYPSEFGGVYNSLPLEFYIQSPALTKFMFFKWGRSFIGPEEFDNYAEWEIPERLSAISKSMKCITKFDAAYYVWDVELIWSLACELDNFHRMHVITTPEMEQIRDALKEILTTLEKTLNGTRGTSMELVSEADFFVSDIDIGFSNYFLQSGDRHLVTFLNNFSFSTIDNNIESFKELKEWTDSFQKLSKQLSGSGSIERKLFFDHQHKIIEQLLG